MRYSQIDRIKAIRGYKQALKSGDCKDLEIYGNLILLQNVKLVKWCAKRFLSFGNDLDELQQVAQIALLHSAKKFKISKGFKFPGYAVRVIITALSRFTSKNKIIPGTYNSKGYIVSTPPVVSMSAPVHDQQGTDLDIEASLYQEEKSHDDIKELCDRIIGEAGLSFADEQLIRLRFGFTGDGGQTLDQIGKKYGVSRERIRQKLERAVKKLKGAAGWIFIKESLKKNPDRLV